MKFCAGVSADPGPAKSPRRRPDSMRGGQREALLGHTMDPATPAVLRVLKASLTRDSRVSPHRLTGHWRSPSHCYIAATYRTSTITTDTEGAFPRDTAAVEAAPAPRLQRKCSATG